MKTVDPEIQEWLDKTGAVLKRDKKHIVYQFPNGKSVSLSSTPSSKNNNDVAIAEIKRMSGWVDPVEIKPPKVRARKQGRFDEPVKDLKRELREALIKVNSLRFELQSVNAAKSRLADDYRLMLESRDEIVNTAQALRRDLVIKQAALNHLQDLRKHCWQCRLKDWWESWLKK